MFKLKLRCTLGHWAGHWRDINHKKWKSGLLILVTINGLLERHFLQINKSILEWVKCDLLRNIFPDPNSQWTSKPIWRLHKIDPKYKPNKRLIYRTNKNITLWVIGVLPTMNQFVRYIQAIQVKFRNRNNSKMKTMEHRTWPSYYFNSRVVPASMGRPSLRAGSHYRTSRIDTRVYRGLHSRLKIKSNFNDRPHEFDQNIRLKTSKVARTISDHRSGRPYRAY